MEETPRNSHFRWRNGGLLLLVTISALAQCIISPPWNLVALQPLAWVPALWAFSRSSRRAALAAGWVAGTIGRMAIYYWLVPSVRNFTALPLSAALAVWLAVGLLSGLELAMFGWGFGAVRRAAGTCWPLAIAAWFTACEFFAPQLFPSSQGMAWYQTPQVFLVSSLTGAAGVTFLVMLFNCVALCLLERFEARANPWAGLTLRRNALALTLLLAAACGWSSFRLAQIDRAERLAPVLRVALVQPDYEIGGRRNREPSQSPQDICLELSRAALSEDPAIDVFVWSEAVLTDPPEFPSNQPVLQFARTSGCEIWTGGLSSGRSFEGDLLRYNSAYRIDATGRVDRRYDKNKPIWFTEYIPLSDRLPFLRKLPAAGAITPGTEQVLFSSPHVQFSFLICYDALQTRYVRHTVQRGARLLVNISNDGWFGDTSCADQHFMLSAVQSAQFGVPLVRAATTGISGFVDARGVIAARTRPFTRGVLVRDLKLVAQVSPYAIAGDWFPWLCAVVSGGLLLMSRQHRLHRIAAG